MKISKAESFGRYLGVAVCVPLVIAALASSPVPAAGQEEEAERVRVPKSANVHKGPMTARVVLVVVPEDTVLPVVGRRGEWFEVELSPELRETGMVIRWYENEETGWVHQSVVEVVD